MVERTIDYWKVTITCLVRKVDINNNKMSKKDVECDMRIDFDQTEHTELKIKVEEK